MAAVFLSVYKPVPKMRAASFLSMGAMKFMPSHL